MLQDYERVLPVLERGFYYGLGRDHYKRANTVLSGKRLAMALADPELSEEEVLGAFNFLMLYTVTQSTVDGKFTTFNTIIDMGGVNVWELPTAGIIRMLNMMQTYY